MISKTELQFVNKFARHVPFPGKSYAINVMESLINAYEIFEKNYLKKEYSFLFSNGDEITFEILEKNLSHLLGIDFKNLISDPMANTCREVLGFGENDFKTSIGILKRIIDRADEVIKNDSNPNSYKILNYYKIMIKTIAFSKLTTFEQFNFGCIEFDKSIYTEKCDLNFTPQFTKLLFTPSNEIITPYFMMGVIYDQVEQKYIPETIIAPENFEDFFINQILLLPIQIMVNDNYDLRKISANSKEKLELLTLYKSIITGFNTNSFIDIYNDYERTLREDVSKVKVKNNI